MRLVLHIGTEKTATTTVQNFVYANKAELARQGVALTSTLGRTNNRKLVAYVMPDERFDDYFRDQRIDTVEEKRKHFEGFEAEFRAEIGALPRSVHTVFITSEHFHSRLKEVESIQRLKGLLDELFTDIEIVCYFREQSAMMQSLYSTAVKSGNSVSFAHFARHCSVDSHYYNFHQFFDKWRQVFGAQRLQARLFARERFVGHDIRKDVLSILLPSKDFDRFDFSVADANASLGYAGLEVGRIVNRRLGKYGQDGARNAARQQLIDILIDSPLGRTGIPPFPNARAIHASFHDSNVQFAREFLGIDRNPFPRPDNRPLAGHRPADQQVALSDVLQFIEQMLESTTAERPARADGSVPGRRRPTSTSPLPPERTRPEVHWRHRLNVLARRLRGRD